MLIPVDFEPANIEILDFYGQETCFVWNKDKLAMFPYSKNMKNAKVSKISVPRSVRGLRGFDSRVYILYEPLGIHKLMKTLELTSLSTMGITNGPNFYEVFVTKNNWLHSQSKSTKSDRRLFQLEKCLDDTYRIHDMTLDKNNSESDLRKRIDSLNNSNGAVCIVANNKRVFMVTRTEVQLIYTSDYEVTGISPIKRKELIAGIILITTNAAVLAYVDNRKLVFNKVHLDSSVRSLCAGIREKFEDTIWLAYLDDARISYWLKSMKENTLDKIKMEFAKHRAIRNINSEYLIILSEGAELSELEIESLKLQKSEDEFFSLKSEMLKGTEGIVNAICERTKELQSWNEKLVKEQEKLKRLNIYSHRHRIVYSPRIKIKRMAGQIFAKVEFDNVLPLNCYIIVGFKSKRQTTQCIKFITDPVVSIDLNLKDGHFDNNTTILVDLVTLAENSKAWCLIRNYLKDPRLEGDSRVTFERKKFLSAKLIQLRSLPNQGQLTLKKLSDLKKSIRRETTGSV